MVLDEFLEPIARGRLILELHGVRDLAGQFASQTVRPPAQRFIETRLGDSNPLTQLPQGNTESLPDRSKPPLIRSRRE